MSGKDDDKGVLGHRGPVAHPGRQMSRKDDDKGMSGHRGPVAHPDRQMLIKEVDKGMSGHRGPVPHPDRQMPRKDDDKGMSGHRGPVPHHGRQLSRNDDDKGMSGHRGPVPHHSRQMSRNDDNGVSGHRGLVAHPGRQMPRKDDDKGVSERLEVAFKDLLKPRSAAEEKLTESELRERAAYVSKIQILMAQEGVAKDEVVALNFAGALQYTKAAREAIVRAYRGRTNVEVNEVVFRAACGWLRGIAIGRNRSDAVKARELLMLAGEPWNVVNEKSNNDNGDEGKNGHENGEGAAVESSSEYRETSTEHSNDE
jgi:hypothetical protein